MELLMLKQKHKHKPSPGVERARSHTILPSEFPGLCNLSLPLKIHLNQRGWGKVGTSRQPDKGMKVEQM